MSQLNDIETHKQLEDKIKYVSQWLATEKGKAFMKKMSETVAEFDFKLGATVEIIDITCEPTISSGVHIGDQHRILDVDILDECVFIDRFDGRWVAMEDLKLIRREEK